jgi:hypothetical protein|tara:strand:+ start:248 stop:1711 length:1464 start_codon:yes stop_codon:yes gene_type:complete
MMRNKKIILISIISLFLIGYVSVYNSIGSQASYLQKIKFLISQDIREFLKETVFVFKNQEQLKRQLENKNKQLADKDKQLTQLADIPNILGFIPFRLNKDINEFKTNNKKIYLKKYQTKILFSSKSHKEGIGNSYLDYFDNNIFIATADGSFAYVNINEFDKDEFKASVIKSNIKDLIRYDRFYISSPHGIKDILIHKNKLYISYSNQVEKDCFNISILVSDLSLTELKFEKFFTPEICVSSAFRAGVSVNSYGEFNAYQTGGRMVPYKNNKILFSVGEFRFRDYAQDKSNIFGKIISIDINTKQYEIISMGHRNPQGLYYDAQNNVIFSTEHGPQGGDEININTNPGGEIENYGWPISSYGEHYGGKILKRNKIKYEKAPLYKSHKDYGFIEPLKNFTPSIAISEIIKIPFEYNKIKKKQFFVGAMGNIPTGGYMSIHHFIISNDNIILKHNIIPLNERIRDMIYVEEINKIFLFLESTASIGVLN